MAIDLEGIRERRKKRGGLTAPVSQADADLDALLAEYEKLHGLLMFSEGARMEDARDHHGDAAVWMRDRERLQQQLGQTRELLAHCRVRMKDCQDDLAATPFEGGVYAAFSECADRLAAIVGED